MELCVVCGGSGIIYIDDTRVKQCVCAYVKKLRIHLGLEISQAATLKASPLYKVGEVDLTTQNLFIKSSWSVLLPHLKYTLGAKGLVFYFRIITDERIKNVFVGAEAYKAKSLGSRDDIASFNSLSDLTGELYDLVIIRLGFLGYKNRAAPGALKETLLIRESFRKATWLVESPEREFSEGHLSYDTDVGHYIESRKFKEVRLEGGEEFAPSDFTDLLEETPGMGVESAGPEREEPPDEPNSYVPNDAPLNGIDGSLLSGGGKKKYKGRF